AVYLGAIVLLDTLLGVATGQTSTLAVTGSTLLVAAAFQPLRRRIQAAVDHRFNRARYDAARPLGGFSGRLREESDPDTRSQLLLATVSDTVRPRDASLWLRGPEEAP